MSENPKKMYPPLYHIKLSACTQTEIPALMFPSPTTKSINVQLLNKQYRKEFPATSNINMSKVLYFILFVGIPGLYLGYALQSFEGL